jgi:short-subunit dehydrogenase
MDTDEEASALRQAQGTIVRKFAVITGATSGIGLEFARVCAAENCDVMLIADQGVDGAAAQLRSAGAAVTTLQVDLSTYEGNEGAAAAIQQGVRRSISSR